MVLNEDEMQRTDHHVFKPSNRSKPLQLGYNWPPMYAKKILLLLISLAIAQAGFTQDKKTNISEMMKTYHDYNKNDGAVLVAKNGKIIYQDAFGLSNWE